MMIALCMSYWANYLGDEEGEGDISRLCFIIQQDNKTLDIPYFEG